jgi:hypothetical protein
MSIERNLVELPMIACDYGTSKRGQAERVFGVAIEDTVNVGETFAQFEIPESQAEQFALELIVLSASIRSWLHYNKKK